MKSRLFILTACCVPLIITQQVNAHYLWVTIDQEQGENGTALIYFEGGPFPGDGSYLDRFFKTGKSWLSRPAEKSTALKNVDVKQEEKNRRWVSAKLDGDAPRSVESYFKFGVYQYGKTFVLLHYYAKNLEVSTHEDLHDLARSKNLALDIVPHDKADQVELTVLWKGKPAKGRTVKLRGPNKFQANVKTDENGMVRFKPEKAGRYTFLSSVEEEVAGEDDGEKYQLIRHQSTLVMKLPLEK